MFSIEKKAWQLIRRHMLALLLAAGVLLSAWVRFAARGYVSWDMTHAFLPWHEQFRAGGLAALKTGVGDYSLASLPVSQLSDSVIDQVLQSVSLPAPIASILQNNLKSQAFAGTKLTEVDIPAGVSISADAFDGTGLVAIYCHDQATVNYAVSHGYVAVVD